ncbi:transposase [Streptomyces sp. NPDC050743]|uniref:transposase n=1 Tax=Streptomyces sp. NPDC050743 TaxID=3365634 RepID=UPI0037B67114
MPATASAVRSSSPSRAATPTTAPSSPPDGGDPGSPHRPRTVPDGPGRPRVRPAHVLGDKGYSSRAIRTWLRRHGISHTIPERADQVRNRLNRGSRHPRSLADVGVTFDDRT